MPSRKRETGPVPTFAAASRATETSRFEQLPFDILRIVVAYIPRRDLPNAARIKVLSDAARLRLYTNVSLRLAQHEDCFDELRLFDAAGPRNMALIQNISILNSKRASQQVQGDIESKSYSFDNYGEWKQRKIYEDFIKRFNSTLQRLLADIPSLRTIRWFHTFSMNHETLASLFRDHLTTLVGIEADRIAGHQLPLFPDQADLPLSPQLKIAIHSVDTMGLEGALSPPLSSVFVRLAERLNHIVLGDERSTYILGIAFATNQDKPRPSLYKALQPLPEEPRFFKNLSKLDIIGLNIGSRPFQSIHLGSFINLYSLRRLSLISCVGTKGLLNMLSAPSSQTTISHGSAQMQLKEFCIRYERPTPGVKKALQQFLVSFNGLELLSVLLDGELEDETIDHTGFMSAHGPTLKTLVWEVRRDRQKRSFSLEDSVGGRPAFFTLLSEKCPNLQELSVPINMRLHIRGNGVDRIRSDGPFAMLRLPNLKTLHCRESFVPKGRLTAAFVVSATKALATSFLDWGTHSQGCSPPLELLAIGPLTLHDRWIQNCRYHDYTVRPDSGPIFYDVSRCTDNVLGISHLLNPLARPTEPRGEVVLDDVEQIRQDYKHTRVFDSYWLR
ncbi:hypothetical protein AJ79_03038 [Helicocarpus griseus UAMH5409]|uniref:Uncharacterized protein n=1 Tax=Helicocarpus griseus UAMH5409 TaxID=1447875 RepID=A0A2B7XYW2_9EURO|nr:hypothetical protein AJ79_03038 [Helicocarpus griseus UAMH5409]